MRSLAVFNGEVLRSGGLLVTPQPSPAGGHRWWISEGRGLLPGQGWGLPRGHTWGPRSGHQWGLSHGHGQTIKRIGGGRTYAGLSFTGWGAQFLVGSVPVSEYLSNDQVDEIGFTNRTQSLMS